MNFPVSFDMLDLALCVAWGDIDDDDDDDDTFIKVSKP